MPRCLKSISVWKSYKIDLGGWSATNFGCENMANEVKKLYEMGIITPQTKFYLAKLNEKPPIKVMTVEQEPRKPLKFIGAIKYDEGGAIIKPPVAPVEPEPIDTSNWVKITPKRREKLAQYRRDKEQYEKDMADYLVAKAEYDALPVSQSVPRGRPVIDYGIDPEIPVLTYWARGFGEVRVCSRPVTHTELEVIECDVNNNYWTQMGFEGHASRRRYKRNRDLDMDGEYDTDLETGEKRQLTLFNCNTSDARKIPDLNVLESFIEKPNSYLAKAYLEYILNGTELTDWQRFQLMRRNSRRTWSIH